MPSASATGVHPAADQPCDEGAALADQVVAAGREPEQRRQLAHQHRQGDAVHVAVADRLGQQLGDEAEAGDAGQHADRARHQRHHRGQRDRRAAGRRPRAAAPRPGSGRPGPSPDRERAPGSARRAHRPAARRSSRRARRSPARRRRPHRRCRPAPAPPSAPGRRRGRRAARPARTAGACAGPAASASGPARRPPCRGRISRPRRRRAHASALRGRAIGGLLLRHVDPLGRRELAPAARARSACAWCVSPAAGTTTSNRRSDTSA